MVYLDFMFIDNWLNILFQLYIKLISQNNEEIRYDNGIGHYLTEITNDDDEEELDHCDKAIMRPTMFLRDSWLHWLHSRPSPALTILAGTFPCLNCDINLDSNSSIKDTVLSRISPSLTFSSADNKLRSLIISFL